MRNRLGLEPQVLALALARTAESVGNSFLIVVLPLFIGSEYVAGSTFGLSEVAVSGLVIALFGFVNSPLQPVTGRFSDRVGKRKVFVVVGLVLLGAASFAYSLATVYWHLIALRIVQGFSGALIIPTTIALVNDLATRTNRGGNMGTYNTFRMVGFGAGPIAAGVVIAGGPYALGLGSISVSFTGFDAAFYLAATTAVTSLLLVSVLIREPDITPTAAGDRVGFEVFDRTGSAVLDPVFTLGVVSFFMTAGITVFAPLADLVNARLGQGPEMFGLQFSAFILAQILLQAPIGRATDSYGRKRFLVLGMALLVPTTYVQGVVLDPWLMFGARFGQGVAGAMVFAPALALAGDLAPEGESGSTLSTVTMAFGMGTAFGPFLSGVLVAYGFAVPFTVGAAFGVVGLVLVATQVEDTVEPSGGPVLSD